MALGLKWRFQRMDSDLFNFLSRFYVIEESIREISYHVVFINVRSKKSYGRGNILAPWRFLKKQPFYHIKYQFSTQETLFPHPFPPIQCWMYSWIFPIRRKFHALRISNQHVVWWLSQPKGHVQQSNAFQHWIGGRGVANDAFSTQETKETVVFA